MFLLICDTKEQVRWRPFLSSQIKCFQIDVFFTMWRHGVPAELFVLTLQMFTRTWLHLSPRGALVPPGLLLMVGLMLYPAGWGSEKVHSYCGPETAPFKPDQCSLGWAFYAAIGGTLASFLCAVLSAQAEIATSSDKVQEEIEEGKSLICVLWNKVINGLQWTERCGCRSERQSLEHKEHHLHSHSLMIKMFIVLY